MWHWLLLAVLPAGLLSMRVDPERIAARLRIEGEDPINAKIRGRRQSPLTKEINIQVTAPLFSSRLFEYGKEAGDQELPTAQDVGKKVDLSQPIKFFGQYFSTVYILSNGGIAFDQNSRSYKPGIMGSNTRMIAPYWNRNDLRIGGHVWYRTVKKGRVLERGASEINYQYGNRVKVQMALLVTWEQMQPLLPEKSTPLPENNTNTFQAAIFVTDNGTYANYIFSSVGWTQGAESGFNKGDEKESYGLPTSGTGNIMFLEDQGNTGIPGEWMFEIGGPRVVRCKVGWKGDTCDQQCAKEEWGADCQGCCHCANGGKCDAVTGECVGNGAKCADCWTGPFCQTKKDNCRNKSPATCAANAISFTDYDRCGEGIQRCQCLSGFQGDGTKSCQDIDECRQSGVCHKEAVCRNTPGRFFCQCRPGFQGDGVKECSPAFLYPNEGHHPLPKSKNSKVTWQLKNPLKIMGKTTDKLTISTSGLITLEDIVDGSVKQLDEIHASGIAPFFAPIDISQKGTVTVAETQDPEAMIRAERSVVENFGGTFSPRSLVTVTYTNVSDAGSSRGNTFQTVFIGGLRDKEPVTYVQLLYKDMPWSDMAEAGIMTNNLETSLILPGSGQSLSNLPSLSNIKQPGVWIYRIDGPAIPACPKEHQLPPYCDQTRVDFKSKEVEANLNKKSENLAIKSQGPIEVGGPRQIIPTFDNGVKSHSQPKVQTTARPRPNFGPSTSHKPLVSLGPDDFNVDPDVFEAVTFPAFQTVQPVLATQSVKKLPDFTVSQSSSTVATVTTPVKSTTRVPETEPTFPTFALDNEESVATVRPLLESRVESSESTEIPVVLGSESDETEEGSKLTGSVEEVTAPSPTTEASRAPIFIFSSSTKATTTTTRKASSVPAKRPPNIVTARATTEVNNYEDHNPGLAVIVPSVIVLIWIALIALIFLVVCCKRRSSASRAHNIYGATYGVRPVGYQFKRGSKHLEGSYEDHLEKAARLSTEMGAYSQPSRLSLYGSYWNLNNSSSSPGSGPSTRQSPPFNQTRYTYTGRY